MNRSDVNFSLSLCLAIALSLTLAALSPSVFAAGGEKPREIDYPNYPPAPESQTQALADTKSNGCITDRKSVV